LDHFQIDLNTPTNTNTQAEAEEVLTGAKAANSRRTAAFCDAQVAELLAAVGAQVNKRGELLMDIYLSFPKPVLLPTYTQVTRLSAGVLDEEALEKGLTTAAHTATPEALAARIGPALLRHTPEGQAAARALVAGVSAVREDARMALAEKIRRVLEEPLSDVCKRIIDVRSVVLVIWGGQFRATNLRQSKRKQAKCESGAYRSVASFERDVEKQCAHFVRKHEVGRKLSKAMLKNVRAFLSFMCMVDRMI
jgi:hypothetical protein